MVRTSAGRCRRCGADVAAAAGEPFDHHLFVRGDEGATEVVLSLCHPCGSEFANVRERDEYVRLGYLG
jgi:hypothetical protein